MAVIFSLIPWAVLAGEYPYGKNMTVIGAPKTYTVPGENDSLIEIARKFNLGFNAIADANPTLDPFVPGAGAAVILPTTWILPDVAIHKGIIINISEMRLYYFPPKNGSTHVITFPIGTGSEENNTPQGRFKIIQKIVKPAWHVPASVKKEKPELPDVVPPGPDNPLGTHAMRLSLGAYLIHGTNRPFGVGRRVSHGCIRLYPEDIPQLFRQVPMSTAVSMVRQPVKVGSKSGRIYIEVHSDEDNKLNNFNEAIRLLTKNSLLKNISTAKLYRALAEKRGFPVDITQ
jgi:L,D-transpeptidase ErfK/SrfK